METILTCSPSPGAQKAAFQAAAPESEHLFLPGLMTAEQIPRSGGAATILGYIPPNLFPT